MGVRPLFFVGFEDCRAISVALDGREGGLTGGCWYLDVVVWLTDAEAQDTVRSAASSGAGF